MLLGESHGCFSDTALIDSSAEVFCLGHDERGAGDSSVAAREGSVKHIWKCLLLTYLEGFGFPGLVYRLYPVLSTVLLLSRQGEEAFMRVC